MPQARPHVVLARLNDEELKLYNWLLRSVAGVTYSKNKSKAFRTFVKRMAEYVKKQRDNELKERYLQYLADSGWPDFEPPTTSHGPYVIEVDGPDEIENLEEAEEIY